MLVSSGMGIDRMGLKKEKEKNRPFQKLRLKTDRRFPSSGSVGEFNFAADAHLFWSAILISPSDSQLFHSAH